MVIKIITLCYIYIEMVKSIINPTNINYSEDTTIDDIDDDFQTTIYDYSVYNLDIEIALGKDKYTYSKNYNIIHFSIYLIVNMELVSRIGIFEIDSNHFINAFDEDGNIKFNLGHIIIFESEPVLKQYVKLKIVDDDSNEPIIINESDDIDNDKQESVTRININSEDIPKSIALNNSVETLQNGIFIIDKNIDVPPLLSEETEIESDNSKNEYLEAVTNNWISKFTKNTNYSIIDNEGSGDCFFAVIRDAFYQIGHKTTIDKLRAILAKEATDTIFNEYKTIYNEFIGELQNIDAQIKEIQKTNKILKKNSTNPMNKQEHSQLIEQVNIMNQTHKQLILSKKETKELLNDYVFMKNIHSLEQFREIVVTSQFWADSWAISTIERVLNIKVIILSQESYTNNDMDGIMQCGYLNDNKQLENPDYYIITSYTGKHYTLIEYKKKRIYKFREIPYDIKSMIINKCLERNSGPYYLIDDFRNYKTSIGLDADYGEPNMDDSDNDLYEKDIIFSFHKRSNPKPKTGKGSGELIDISNIIKFAALNTTDVNSCCYDWRKKLDDHWMKSPFSIDNKKWASVKHYVLGSQYKKGFPDFYLKFSLDSNSEISNNIDFAIAATSKSGKIKDKILRPSTVKQDADFYEYGVNNRYEIERKNALLSKFTQNTDLHKILTTTYPAKLNIFVRGKEHEPDEQLMQVRKELLTTNSI